MEILKSDSLKSYDTFQPIFPYFFLSYTTAWKNDSTKIRGRKASLSHSSRTFSEICFHLSFMFLAKPSGGSVTTLRDLCRIVNGNFSVGSVVSHSLYSVLGLVVYSNSFSRLLSQEVSKWQFCSMTQ